MDIKNTFSVYKTLIEMLSDRGYDMSNYVEYDEFVIMYEENNYDIIDKDKKIIVTFYKDTKAFTKKDLEIVVQNAKEKCENENINIIIILKDKYTVTIEKELVNPLYKNVEIFLFKNLTFNITKHDDMPKHILLTDDEIKDLFDKYKMTKSQVPKVSYNDPIAKYYGTKPGNMFKIIRQSNNAGEYITYRYVH
jgi:DNA-directed RNA polymerase I, II, and III subunit RPABC1